jgi:hypothetical protein
MSIASCAQGRDSALDIPRRLLHPPREAEILPGISHAQLYRLLAGGRLKKVKLGSRTGITLRRGPSGRRIALALASAPA